MTERYVTKRGVSCVYRRDIPATFRFLLGRTAWFVVLSEDKDEARRLGRQKRAEHDKILAGLRSPDIQRLIKQASNDELIQEALDGLKGERLD